VPDDVCADVVRGVVETAAAPANALTADMKDRRL
jgi:hypothetical protein